MIGFFSLCSSCLRCCPFSYNQNSEFHNDNINPVKVISGNQEIRCQLVTVKKLIDENQIETADQNSISLNLFGDDKIFIKKTEANETQINDSEAQIQAKKESVIEVKDITELNSIKQEPESIAKNPPTFSKRTEQKRTLDVNENINEEGDNDNINVQRILFKSSLCGEFPLPIDGKVNEKIVGFNTLTAKISSEKLSRKYSDRSIL
jgi:hypothetical protein